MRKAHRNAHVLLVDAIGERRQRVATLLRGRGRRVTEAATPLEAIYCLDQPMPPQYMEIAETSPANIGEELCAYVIAEHGDVEMMRATGRRA